MRLASELTADKLRGGYYTPDFVVDVCIQRAQSLIDPVPEVTILEPSAGDGAFLRGVARSSSWSHSASFVCVEKATSEAAACRRSAKSAGVPCAVVAGSFFDWDAATNAMFDCILGNPPFVRYQFVPPEDRTAAEGQLKRHGIELAGVSNLFIPFVLLSMQRLRPGGAFAMVLPSEVLCTTSGEQVRAALLGGLDDLQVDLFPREAFPDILQDVAVFTGRKRDVAVEVGSVRFVEHSRAGSSSWTHRIALTDRKWTRFLLEDSLIQAFASARQLPSVHSLGDIARFSVSIVTGANGYFAVRSATVDAHCMTDWARPLMSRSFDSPGLVFRASDHQTAVSQDRPAWLLDFNAQAPDPREYPGAAQYLRAGEESGIQNRYKCRIRSPWYRVPHVWAGSLMLSKRASLHHRIILNEAAVLTTDTVYRGTMKPTFANKERDLVAGFHNSLTLLSSEIEGRTYGGGVLELVPSEISSLLVPMLPTNGHLEKLDELSRSAGGQKDPEERLVHETNRILVKALPGYAELVEPLESARQRLRRRRFDIQASD